MNALNSITISVDAGDDGQASVMVHRDSQVGELVAAVERLLLFLGYHQDSIRRAFDEAAALDYKPAEGEPE